MKNISLLIILIASLIMASCHQPEKKTELEDQYAVSKKLEADSLNIYAMERSKDSVENIGIKGYNLKLISKGAGVDRLELEYHSQAQLLDKIRKEGKEKMSTESSINSDLELEISTSRGGQIQVSDYDNSIGSADIGYVEVIVKDTTDMELYRQGFNSKTPNVVGTEFMGFGIARIPTKVSAPFYIYVVHKIGKTPYKYLVTAIKK